MIISAAMPVYDGRNKFVGVLAIDLSLANLSEQISGIKIGETGYPFIFDNNHNLMIHPNPDKIGGPSAVPELTAYIAAGNSGLVEYVLEGAPKVAAVDYVTDLGWPIAASLPIKKLKTSHSEL